MQFRLMKVDSPLSSHRCWDMDVPVPLFSDCAALDLHQI
jgi:hypothetical protein